MSTFIKNAAPRPILTGFKDVSGRRTLVPREEIPQHLPFFYLMTKRGRLKPLLCSGASMMENFGTESFEERSKYFSHQTLAATICNAVGNKVYIKRVVAPDAARASLVFGLEIVKDDIPVYERNPDGTVMRDINGAKITHPTDTVDGYRIAWTIKALDDVDNLRGEVQRAGALVGRAGETATYYPLWAMRMEYGDVGNNIGIRFSFPGPSTPEPADMSLVELMHSTLYRAQIVERKDVFSLPNIQYTLNGESYVEFSLKDDAVNPKTDQDLVFERLRTDWEEIDPTSGFEPIYGPLEDFHIYRDNIDAVLETLLAAEVAAGGRNWDDAHQLNIMSGVDYEDKDYYGFMIDDTSINMDSDTTHYGIGGSDGTVNEQVLAELVANECENNWENPEYPLVDMFQFPFSVVYDTGFPLETKKSILGVMRYRKDISVGACTQDLLERDNRVSEESSIMTALRAYARLIPESVIHGTPVCRATIVGQVGTRIHSRYRNRSPLLMELIEKRARYMGASDGRYKGRWAYDISPTNRIETIRDVTHPWKPDITRSRDWEVGLNWAQYADTRSLFFPALQTIYDDDTSVLNSDINMLIAVDVAKKSAQVWAEMTGNSFYADDQFLEECNRKLRQKVDGLYHERVTIVPDCFFTEADEARGYSWTMNVHIYMNNMRTVATINVITHRRSDLVQSA